VADAFLFGNFDAEVTGFIEEFGEVTAHVRREGADDFVGGDAGFANALADVLLNVLAVQHLISGLIGAGSGIAGSDGGAGAVASIVEEFIDE